MYVKGINLVFWGLIFRFLNVCIYKVDILPSIIGTIMMIIGLFRIHNGSFNFSISCIFSLLELPFLAFEFFNLRLNFITNPYVFDTIFLLFDFVVTFYIFRGIRDFAVDAGFHDMVSVVTRRRTEYIICFLIFNILFYFLGVSLALIGIAFTDLILLFTVRLSYDVFEIVDKKQLHVHHTLRPHLSFHSKQK